MLHFKEISHMKKITAALIFTAFATGVSVTLATIITSPSYQFLAVWVGGSGSAATSTSYKHTGSIGQPMGGTATTSANYKLHGGFIQQFPLSQSGTSSASVNPGQAATLTINPPSGSISISIPVGTFDEAVTVTASIPTSFAVANSNLASLNGTQVGVELASDKSLQLQQPVTVTLHYRDFDIQGMDESRLRVAYYIPSEGRWVPLDSTIDAANNSITARAGITGIFRIVEMTAASDAQSVFVYPNPLRFGRGHTEMHLTKLPEGVTVQIFTLAGELVRDLRTDATGEARWDGKNGDGESVASGTYLALVKNGSDTKTLKLAVER